MPSGTEAASTPASAPAAASASPRTDGADRDTQQWERMNRVIQHYAYLHAHQDEEEVTRGIGQILSIGLALGHINPNVTPDEHD